MKKLLFYISFASLLVACAGGGSNSKLPFGNIPQIVFEANQKIDAIDEQGPAYDKAAAKIIDKAEKRALSEANELIGRQVPITKGENLPFDVQKATITEVDIKGSGGNLNCSIKVVLEIAAQREMNIKTDDLNNAALYFLIANEQKQVIESGVLNPMLDKRWVVRVQKIKQSLQPGELCNDAGTALTFNCHSIDYSTFSHIVFMSKDDYDQLFKK